VLVEHSFPKAKRSVPSLPATVTRQAALKNASLSLAPADLFSGPSEAPEHPGARGVAGLHPGDPP